MRAISFFILLTLAGISSANVRYTYTGANFSSITTSAFPTTLEPRDPTLSVADRITGFIETAEPLAANGSFVLDSSNTVAFEFTDGTRTINDFTRLDAGQDFLMVDTDGDGNIVSWYISLIDRSTSADLTGERSIELLGDAFSIDAVTLVECLNPNCTSLYQEDASTNTAGTFSAAVEVVAETPAATVPLPVLALAALGALLAGLGVRRQTRTR